MEKTGQAFDEGCEAPAIGAVVDFIAFDQLEDCTSDLEAFLKETVTMSQVPTEFWTEQFQCLNNLRVLNKVHIGFLE